MIAQIFVHRVAHYCNDIAMYRCDNAVTVIDGSHAGQRDEILRLARGSGALRVQIGDAAITRSR